jgi:hypothetical protein
MDRRVELDGENNRNANTLTCRRHGVFFGGDAPTRFAKVAEIPAVAIPMRPQPAGNVPLRQPQEQSPYV